MYRLTVEELPASMGVPMEGFFDGVDVALTTPAPSASAHGVPTEAPIPHSDPVPREDGAHTERVSETTPIPAKTPAFPEGVIPVAVQTEAASPILPLVISTSDPFTALSQAVKDGSSLVVTPSSIPSFATRGPDADLSSKEFEDILEDPEDELFLKKRVLTLMKRRVLPLRPNSWVCVFLFPFSFFYFLFFIIHMYLCCSLLQSSFYLYACFLVCRDL